jgi:hypothetical protein
MFNLYKKKTQRREINEVRGREKKLDGRLVGILNYPLGSSQYIRTSLPCNVTAVDLKYFFRFPKLLNFLLCRIKYW